MSERKFDKPFLARLERAMSAIAQEAAEGDDGSDPRPLDAKDHEAIYAAYAESGGDPAVAKQRLALARKQCDQALARILQCIADQYGIGPVEQLDERGLADIARDAFAATENWLDDVEMGGGLAKPPNPLQVLLETHCRLHEALVALHDQVLWPIARRISGHD